MADSSGVGLDGKVYLDRMASLKSLTYTTEAEMLGLRRRTARVEGSGYGGSS